MPNENAWQTNVRQPAYVSNNLYFGITTLNLNRFDLSIRRRANSPHAGKTSAVLFQEGGGIFLFRLCTEIATIGNLQTVFPMKHRIVLLLLLWGCNQTVSAQSPEKAAAPRSLTAEIGKGIVYRSPNKVFSLTTRLRMQDLVALSFDRDFTLTEIEARIKRLQIKFDGYLYSPRLTYLIQIGFTGHAANARSNSNIIGDAILHYRLSAAWSIGLGQTKIQANRAQIASSGVLQFVDRSIVNDEFNSDRDFGLFVRYDMPRDEGFTFTGKASVTLGEGRNWGKSPGGGLVYTRRIELYPLGRFKEKGETTEGDLAHEPRLKMMVAGAYSYNRKAMRTRGQRGDLLPDGATRNLGNWYADLLLKYRGFSFCADFMGRTCSDPLFDDEARTWIYTGWGLNVQTGYTIRRKWEIALRNSTLFPRAEVRSRAGYRRDNRTSLGVSRYIAGHALKVQADISYAHRSDATTTDYTRWFFAFQLEVGI